MSLCKMAKGILISFSFQDLIRFVPTPQSREKTSETQLLLGVHRIYFKIHPVPPRIELNIKILVYT